MSKGVEQIPLAKFNDLKADLTDSGHIPGEINVWAGTHVDYGYVVLVESDHHGCLLITGTSIIAVNDGIKVL